MSQINTLLDESVEQIEVKKSKFIGIAFHCEDIESFMKRLDAVKKEWPNARHYCYAYRFSNPILTEKYQDDKEPSGTAGMPMLEVLKGKELQEVGVIVVRYFGGTLLGTGGLARAYSDTARLAIEAGDIVIKQEALQIKLALDYTNSGKIEYYINQESIPLVHTEYGVGVEYTIAIAKEEKENIINALIELVNGQVTTEVVKETMGYFNASTFVEV